MKNKKVALIAYERRWKAPTIQLRIVVVLLKDFYIRRMEFKCKLTCAVFSQRDFSILLLQENSGCSIWWCFVIPWILKIIGRVRSKNSRFWILMKSTRIFKILITDAQKNPGKNIFWNFGSHEQSQILDFLYSEIPINDFFIIFPRIMIPNYNSQKSHSICTWKKIQLQKGEFQHWNEKKRKITKWNP